MLLLFFLYFTKLYSLLSYLLCVDKWSNKYALGKVHGKKFKIHMHYKGSKSELHLGILHRSLAAGIPSKQKYAALLKQLTLICHNQAQSRIINSHWVVCVCVSVCTIHWLMSMYWYKIYVNFGNFALLLQFSKAPENLLWRVPQPSGAEFPPN